MPSQEPVVGIVAGNRGIFLATPIDAQGNPAIITTSLPPTWFSSDSINAPVVAAADGLSAHVDVPANADPSVHTFNLNVSCQIQGGVTIQGAVSVPIFPVPNVTPVSFVLTQTT